MVDFYGVKGTTPTMKRILLSAALAAGLAASAGADDDFAKAVPFTTSGYRGAAPLANFPVLVRLSTAIEGFDYADVGTGTNLLFKDAAGTVLPHEVDTWDPDGTSLVWVRVPSVTATTTFKMFYGGSSDAVNAPAEVWTGAEYVGVWHMDEADGAVADATGHGLAATPTPATGASASVRYAGADAPVGHARQTGTSATKCYLSMPSYDSFAVGDTFTMSGWVRLTENVANNPRLFSRKDSYSSNNGWEIEMATASPASFNVRGAARDKDTCKGAFSPNLQNRWTHVALVYDGTTCTVYSNGYALVSGTVTPATDNGLPLSIGCDSDGTEANVRGAFDECRLLDAAASADWIAAEYATVADAAFVVAGPAESTAPVVEPRFDFLRKVSFAVAYPDGADLAGLPVLVRLSADHPAGFSYRDCAPDGSDLFFADASDRPIPFEIDTWDPAGESLVWVKVPSLAQGTAFTMFFKGTSGVANNPSGVWTDYTGVWHLNGLGADDPATWPSQGLYPNSTAASGIDGHLSTNSVPGEPGRFGKSFRVNDSTGPNAGNYAEGGVWVNDAGADSPLDAGGVFTISGWFKHGNWNFNWDNLFYKRMNETNDRDPTGSFMARISSQVSDTKVSIRGAGSSRVRLENASEMHESMIDNWVYLTLVFNGTTGAIYENGALCRSGTFNVATDNDAPLVFGNTAAIAGGATGEQAWNGWIDEVRYLRAAKSADWIAAEYAAMADASFLTAGAVEWIAKGTVLVVR